MAHPIVVDLVASVNKRANENQFVGMPRNLFLLSRHFAVSYCNSINIKLVFSSFKIGNMFGVKYPILRGLREVVVYRFLCAGYSARYVRGTIWHFSSRVLERMFSDRTSHSFKHLQNSEQCSTYALRTV